MITSASPLNSEFIEELLLNSNYTPSRLKTWQLANVVFLGLARLPPDRDDFCVRQNGSRLEVSMSVAAFRRALWTLRLTKKGADPWRISVVMDKATINRYMDVTFMPRLNVDSLEIVTSKRT